MHVGATQARQHASASAATTAFALAVSTCSLTPGSAPAHAAAALVSPEALWALLAQIAEHTAASATAAAMRILVRTELYGADSSLRQSVPMWPSARVYTMA